MYSYERRGFRPHIIMNYDVLCCLQRLEVDDVDIAAVHVAAKWFVKAVILPIRSESSKGSLHTRAHSVENLRPTQRKTS